MRLTLQRKFFIALALLLALLLAIFVVLSRIGLQRGIGPYVAEIELSRLDWMVSNLREAHAREGGWAFLKTNPDAWHELQLPIGMARDMEARRRARLAGQDGPQAPGDARGPGGPSSRGPAGGGFGAGGPGGPPKDRMRFSPQLDVLPERYLPPPPPNVRSDPRASRDSLYSRLSLIDANGRDVLAGNVTPDPHALRRPIDSASRTVGYLALSPLQGVGSKADEAFVAQQFQFIVYAGIAGLALALLISAWMARRWLEPLERLVGAARDVAEGKRDVTVPVKGTDEFAELSITFNDMAGKLAAIEESRQQWLSDVAHELRTPVAAMRAEIEAVQDGVRTFDDSTARRLHVQVMRMAKLVDDLRLVMQDASAQAPVAMTPVLPLDVLLETLDSMLPMIEKQQLKVEGVTEVRALAIAGQPRVRGDTIRLAQVFSNLLENSVRYTHAGGVLRLQASIEHGKKPMLVIAIEDSAPGPRHEDFPRLFDRFFRGESSRSREHGGAGLGLAICRAIVQAHEGTITATPSDIGGLRMAVRLPIITP